MLYSVIWDPHDNIYIWYSNYIHLAWFFRMTLPRLVGIRPLSILQRGWIQGLQGLSHSQVSRSFPGTFVRWLFIYIYIYIYITYIYIYIYPLCLCISTGMSIYPRHISLNNLELKNKCPQIHLSITISLKNCRFEGTIWQLWFPYTRCGLKTQWLLIL